MQAAQQSAFLVLLAHLDARLLEDLEPGVCQGLPHAHPLLLLVDEQVGHEVLRLAGDVLPQLEVEVDVAHLDALQRLAVVLRSDDGKERRREFTLKVCRSSLDLIPLTDGRRRRTRTYNVAAEMWMCAETVSKLVSNDCHDDHERTCFLPKIQKVFHWPNYFMQACLNLYRVVSYNMRTTALTPPTGVSLQRQRFSTK